LHKKSECRAQEELEGLTTSSRALQKGKRKMAERRTRKKKKTSRRNRSNKGKEVEQEVYGGAQSDDRSKQNRDIALQNG